MHSCFRFAVNAGISALLPVIRKRLWYAGDCPWQDTSFWPDRCGIDPAFLAAHGIRGQTFLSSDKKVRADVQEPGPGAHRHPDQSDLDRFIPEPGISAPVVLYRRTSLDMAQDFSNPPDHLIAEFQFLAYLHSARRAADDDTHTSSGICCPINLSGST